jgi:hypothetical protein
MPEDILIQSAKVTDYMMMIVTFSSGERRLFDATELSEASFEPLCDTAAFNDFKVEHGALTWAGGSIVCTPEHIYEHSYPYDALGEVVTVCKDTIPSIRSVQPADDYCLSVTFDDGKRVLYDVKGDIARLPFYGDLRSVPGLFGKVQIDKSRTCVYWNDMIDLPSDAIYAEGKEV